MSAGRGHTIRLADGADLLIDVCEGPLGVEGAYRVRVLSTKGPLLVVPSSGNSVELITPRALELETEAVRVAVLQRDAARSAARTHDPRRKP